MAEGPDMDDFPTPPDDRAESPHHGFRGDRPAPAPGLPAALTVAVSREAGARGSAVARRAARALGWQLFDQETLEYVGTEGPLRQEVLDGLTPAAAAWVEERLEALLKAQNLSQHPSVVGLARTILALGVQGRVVLIGRGAGFLLPPATTLHARVVAPLADRIAYVSQWQRLTPEEAAERVRLRDGRRTEFIATHFHRQPAEVYHYDLVLNSGLLGEDLCCDMLVQAAKAKERLVRPATGDEAVGHS